jgi:hypothetical protein
MKSKLALIIGFFCLMGLNNPVWSQGPEPPPTEDNSGPEPPPTDDDFGPDPPPTAPIKQFLYITLFIGIAYAGNKLYTNKKD